MADPITTPNPVPDPTTPNGGGGDEKKFTQADLDHHLRERETRDENAARRRVLDGLGIKTEDDLKAQLADYAKLRESQMSEQEKAKQALEAATTRTSELEAKVGELDGLKKTQEKYETALKGQLKVLKEGLPEHIVKLLDKLEPVEQLEYITANADVLRKRPDRIPGTPTPADATKLSAAEQEAQKQKYAEQVRRY